MGVLSPAPSCYTRLMNIGDIVECIDPPYPEYRGRTATIRALEGSNLVFVDWHHIKSRGKNGPWYAHRFKKLAPATPFEQSAQEYIRANL